MTSASYRPCIENHEDGFLLSADVKPLYADAPPDGEVIVWLWLMLLDYDLIDEERNDLTRDESTLFKCPVSFDSGDQVVVCGPHLVEPPGQVPGNYTTAGIIVRKDSALPHMWDSPSVSGTMVGNRLPWPPQTTDPEASEADEGNPARKRHYSRAA